MTDWIKKIADTAAKAADKTVDAVEALSPPNWRGGCSSECIPEEKGRPRGPCASDDQDEARNNKIDPEVFAAEGMPVIAKLLRANKRGPALTKAQNGQLIRNHTAAESEADGAEDVNGLHG